MQAVSCPRGPSASPVSQVFEQPAGLAHEVVEPGADRRGKGDVQEFGVQHHWTAVGGGPLSMTAPPVSPQTYRNTRLYRVSHPSSGSAVVPASSQCHTGRSSPDVPLAGSAPSRAGCHASRHDRISLERCRISGCPFCRLPRPDTLRRPQALKQKSRIQPGSWGSHGSDHGIRLSRSSTSNRLCGNICGHNESYSIRRNDCSLVI